MSAQVFSFIDHLQRLVTVAFSPMALHLLLRLSPCSKWADLNGGEDEKMVSLIVSEIMCAINFISHF